MFIKIIKYQIKSYYISNKSLYNYLIYLDQPFIGKIQILKIIYFRKKFYANLNEFNFVYLFILNLIIYL